MGDPVQYPRPRPRVRRQVEVDDIPEAGDEISVPVRHLPADAAVRLQVRVLNKYYVGPASDNIVFTTHEGGNV